MRTWLPDHRSVLPVDYWRTAYDRRKVEENLNAIPMYVTEIDGLDIQFIHVRSRHPNTLPLIITHSGRRSDQCADRSALETGHNRCQLSRYGATHR